MNELAHECSQCQLFQRSGARSPNLPVIGTPNPWLYVIGNNPDQSDDRNGRIFSGRSSEDFGEALKDIGGEVEKCRFSNAIRCLPKGAIGTDELTICSKRTRDDIEVTKPRAILCLGEEALRTLWPNGYEDIFSITRTRGGLIPYTMESGEIIGVVPTLSQAFMGRQGDFIPPELTQAWVDDISLAWDTASIGTTVFKEWQEQGLYEEPNELILVKTVAQVQTLFEKLKTASKVAFDFETTSLKPWKLKEHKGNEPVLFSIAFAFDNETHALPLYNYWSTKVQASIIEALGKWFVEACPEQIKIAHNLKFDLLWGLIHAGEKYFNYTVPTERITPVGQYHDTQQIAWILDERPSMCKLKVAAWKYLGKNDWSIDAKNVLKYPVDEVLKYNALDSWYTLKLFQYGEDEILKDESYSKLYTEIMLPSALSFLKVEARGCIIDEQRRLDMAKRLDDEAEELVKQVRIETGNNDLNPASPKQIGEYFVNECKYELLKKTKTGWSVDAATLEHVANTYDDKAAKLLLELRGIQKLNGTYVTGLADKIYIDGKIHGGYNTTGTVTGRTSSNDPNMQNFPKRKHKEVRGIIIPPKGYKIVSTDYGQIEARLFGAITGDPEFIKALWNDWDIHLENSRTLFGDSRAKEMRGPVKNGTFALLYGAGDKKVSATTGAPIESIAKLRKLIFERFKLFQVWQKDIASFEKRNGYVESLFGKRRRSPMTYNDLLNHTNQSTASDMTLTAMNILGRKYDVCWMVHDDLSFYIKEDEVEEAIIDIAQAMLTIPWLYIGKSKWLKSYVPLSVEASIGDNWADLEDVLKVSSVDFGFKSIKDSVNYATKYIESL